MALSGPAVSAIQRAAAKYNVNPDVMLALAHHESGLNPNAVGDGGHAIGLFQLNNAGGVLTGQSQAAFRSYADPYKNASYAAQALAKLGIVRGSGSVESQIAQGVDRFERPANRQGEKNDSIAWYQSTLKGGQLPAITTPAAGVPQTSTAANGMAGQLQPAATNPVDAGRSQIIQYLLGQNSVNAARIPTTGGNPQTQAAAVSAAQAAAPSVQSIFQSATAATQTGTPQVAGTLTHATTGQQVPVVMQPGVKPNAITANAIATAKKYLGTPYHFGGASPKTGFDCSGLLQFVYKQQGINIPRIASDQAKAGEAINIKNIQPGDAVFFAGSDGTAQNPGHVGMYIGGGNFIEAPHTGDVIKIAKLTGYDGGVVSIRRYTNMKGK